MYLFHVIQKKHRYLVLYSDPRMKISVITDISVLRFYGYIGNISADILEKISISLKLLKIMKM